MAGKNRLTAKTVALPASGARRKAMFPPMVIVSASPEFSLILRSGVFAASSKDERALWPHGSRRRWRASSP
jgi:hypothetical protein